MIVVPNLLESLLFLKLERDPIDKQKDNKTRIKLKRPDFPYPFTEVVSV